MPSRSSLPLVACLIAGALSLSDAAAQPVYYSVTNLAGLGGSTSSAAAINCAGDVAGFSLIAGDSATHAFRFSNGTITDLGTLAGYPGSQATGINRNGDVVGIATNGSTSYRAFLYRNGVMQDLGTLGGQTSFAEGINDSGQIVGSSAVSGVEVPRHAFLYANGVMHDVGTLGGTNAVATAINNAGQITGSSDVTNNSTDHSFLYNVSMTDLDVASNDGLFNCAGYGINNSGAIAGATSGVQNNSGHSRAILYQNNTVTDIGSLGGLYNYASSINDNGDIVGHSANTSPPTITPYGDTSRRAFLYRDGVMYDLNSLVTTSGWTVYDASGINDSGQIAGTGIFGGHYYAIRLDPVTLAVSHTKCYTITDPAPKAFYTLNSTATPEPPQNGCVLQVPAKMLCLATTKTNVSPVPPGGGPQATVTTTKSLCYKVKCPRVALTPVPVVDQFGSRTVTPKVAKILCAPASPGGAFLDDPTL